MNGVSPFAFQFLLSENVLRCEIQGQWVFKVKTVRSRTTPSSMEWAELKAAKLLPNGVKALEGSKLTGLVRLSLGGVVC